MLPSLHILQPTEDDIREVEFWWLGQKRPVANRPKLLQWTVTPPEERALSSSLERRNFPSLKTVQHYSRLATWPLAWDNVNDFPPTPQKCKIKSLPASSHLKCLHLFLLWNVSDKALLLYKSGANAAQRQLHQELWSHDCGTLVHCPSPSVRPATFLKRSWILCAITLRK